jgi:hypothetical protein
MPPPSIPRKVEDIIFYYYAKLVIAPSAGFQTNYQFILSTYKRLKNGEIRISDYERELLHLSEERVCAFCRTNNNSLFAVHVIPRGVCVTTGMQNLVMACKTCVDSKGEEDLIEWWCEHLGRERDEIPRLPIGLYLKNAYEFHKINFSLRKNCESLQQLFNIKV